MCQSAKRYNGAKPFVCAAAQSNQQNCLRKNESTFHRAQIPPDYYHNGLMIMSKIGSHRQHHSKCAEFNFIGRPQIVRSRFKLSGQRFQVNAKHDEHRVQSATFLAEILISFSESQNFRMK